MLEKVIEYELVAVAVQHRVWHHRIRIPACRVEKRYRLPRFAEDQVGCSVDLHPSPLPAPQPISCHYPWDLGPSQATVESDGPVPYAPHLIYTP